MVAVLSEADVILGIRFAKKSVKNLFQNHRKSFSSKTDFE
jgi:hypothetical protein